MSSATKKYKRAGSHESTKSMMTLPDSSDDDSDMGITSSHGKQRPKKKLPEKRRRKSIESDGSSRFSCDEIYSGRSNNSALKKRKEKHLGKFSSEGKSSISGVVPLKSDQSGAIPTGYKDILGVRSFNKKGIKPMLKVNDEVYAAWWPDERSRSTNSQCSWYEGRVKSVRAVDKGADYGPVYYYSIEYDDGDKEDDLKDVYVWPQADYLLNTSKKRDWIGVKCVQDEHSTDEWAKISGFYTANIDGQERAFSLLSEALRAYDAFVVRQLGEETKPSQLNLPREWDFPHGKGEIPMPKLHNEKKKFSLSDIKGFHFHVGSKKYQAGIGYQGKNLYLGQYELSSDAALAYDQALRQLKGWNSLGSNFATNEDHKRMRAMELETTGVEVDFHDVKQYMASAINEMMLKVREDDLTLDHSDHDISEDEMMPALLSVKGIYFNNNSQKYQADLNYGGKSHYLGLYTLASDAVLAVEKAQRLVHGHTVGETMFATKEDHKRVRGIESKISGLNVDFDEVQDYMSSRISKIMSGNDAFVSNLARCGNGRSSGNHRDVDSKISEGRHTKLSTYVGVSSHGSKYTSYVNNNKRVHLGSYLAEADAAYARDEAVKLLNLGTATNFASLQSYKDAKLREIQTRGLAIDSTMTSSEIKSKVNKCIYKALAAVEHEAAEDESTVREQHDTNGSKTPRKIDSASKSPEVSHSSNTSTDPSKPSKGGAKRKHSLFSGVTFNKNSQKFQAYHKGHSKFLNFGTFSLETDAAFASDEGTKLLGLDLAQNFKTLQDYEKEQARELDKRGMGASFAMDAKAVKSKVAEFVRKSSATSSFKHCKSPTCPEVTALNEAMAKKWEKYLPSTSGTAFLSEYQNSIDEMMTELKNHSNISSLNDTPMPSSALVDNATQVAGKSLQQKQRNGTIVTETVSSDQKAVGGSEKVEPLEEPPSTSKEVMNSGTQMKTSARTAKLYRTSNQVNTVKNRKVAAACSSAEGDSAAPTSKRATKKKAQPKATDEASTTSAKSLARSAASNDSRTKKKTQLIELTGGQVEGLGLPFHAGVNVWFQFDRANSDGKQGQSFCTGKITGCFIDLSSASKDTLYKVKSDADDGNHIEMLSENELCFAPGSKVNVSNDETNLPGEVLMCQAKTHHQANVQAVFGIKQALAKERARQSDQNHGECETLLELLQKLDKISMTRAILQETMIGKGLKQLKKHGDDRVAQLTCNTIDNWKEIANNKEPTNDNTLIFVYTVLIAGEGSQFFIEKNIASKRLKSRKALGGRENESSSSTITSTN